MQKNKILSLIGKLKKNLSLEMIITAIFSFTMEQWTISQWPEKCV